MTAWGIDPAVPDGDMAGMVVWETLADSDGNPVSKIRLTVLKSRCPQGCLCPMDEREER